MKITGMFFGSSSSCPHFYPSTRPYSLDFQRKYKLWPNLQSDTDLIDGESVYGSKSALEIVHKHQNPMSSADCKNHNFVISLGHPNGGFGSQMHVDGMALAIAMNLDRILITLPFDKGGNVFHNVPFCQSRNVKGYDCYWERWSICGLSDALEEGKDIGSYQPYSFEDFHFDPNDRNTIHKLEAFKDTKTIVLSPSISHFGHPIMNNLPKQLVKLRDCAPLLPKHKKYWWRSIAAAYMVHQQ